MLLYLEVADEVDLVLGQLLGADAVRCAYGGVLVDFVRAPDGQELSFWQLALTHMAYFTLICCCSRYFLDIMERVLKVFFTLGIHVVANLGEIILLQSLIIDLHNRVPLDLLNALV